MINKPIDDKLFDSVLSQAFLDAAEEESDEIQMDEIKYSAKYRREERKKYNKVMRASCLTQEKRAVRTVLKRAASFILVIGVILSIIMLTAPGIRAEFFNLATTFFEKYFSVSVGNNAHTYETTKYVFGYIPDYLPEVEVDEADDSSYYAFKSADGVKYVSVFIYPAEFGTMQYDNEHTSLEEINIDGFRGYLITSDIDEIAGIVWSDDIKMYSITGNIKLVDLKKLAGSIDEVVE